MDIHPPLQDLTRAAYDQGPSPDHVFWCGDCLEILERLRQERALLTRARSRPVPPNPLTTFFTRLFRRSPNCD